MVEEKESCILFFWKRGVGNEVCEGFETGGVIAVDVMSRFVAVSEGFIYSISPWQLEGMLNPFRHRGCKLRSALLLQRD